ncbi:hypothetical protein ACTM4I_25395, partial [Citrobacter freundii]
RDAAIAGSHASSVSARIPSLTSCNDTELTLRVSFRPQPEPTPISQLMQSSPNDEYLIAASPVYIAAVQNDILKGIESLTHPLTQLTIVTSGAYAGPLEEYLIKSSSRMMKELECNMVCLNIKLAQYILKSGSR